MNIARWTRCAAPDAVRSRPAGILWRPMPTATIDTVHQRALTRITSTAGSAGRVGPVHTTQMSHPATVGG